MKSSKTIRVERLTALWALNESGLGGFLHVFNTPFTGLIVGGISILMIGLIAYYSENKWQTILKALMIVLIVKMAVSPHSPVGAYLAVAFQGVFGALLFSKFSWKGLTLPFLGFITFLESAFQKLVILTLIYGNGFWEALDLYGLWVQSKINSSTNSSASEILIVGYLTFYAVCGVVAGFFIKSLISTIAESPLKEFQLPKTIKENSKRHKAKKKSRKFLILWLSVLSLLVLAFTLFGDSGFGWQKGIYLLLRSALVLGLWYLVLGPLILTLLGRFLKSRKSKYEDEVKQTLDLLPYLRAIIKYSWMETSHLRGYLRFKTFIAQSISSSIHFNI